MRPLVGVLGVSVMLVACGDGRGGRASGGDDSPFEELLDLPEVTGLNAVWAFASDDVWVAADNGKMLHFDGASWRVDELGFGETMQDMWGFAPDDLWAVGGTSLARWDGSNWTLEDLAATGQGISGVGVIWANAPDDVWIGGDQSTAAHFDGSSWRRYIAAGSENLALWSPGPNDAWVGSVFEVARFDGSVWAEVDEDELRGASAIFGFAADDLWVADDAELAHFDGSSWSFEELDGLDQIGAMWGNAPDDLWGVGDFGTIVHFDGEGWEEIQNQPIGAPYLQSFLDVHVSAQGEVWVVGALYGEGGITPQLWRAQP